MKRLKDRDILCYWTSGDRPAAAKVPSASVRTIRRRLRLMQRDREIEAFDGFPDDVYRVHAERWREGADSRSR